MDHEVDNGLICNFSACLYCREDEISRNYRNLAPNVRTVLRRHHASVTRPSSDRPVCKFIGEEPLLQELAARSMEVALFTLARIYDKGHIILCETAAAALAGKPYNEGFREHPLVDLTLLIGQTSKFSDLPEIDFGAAHQHTTPLIARWVPLTQMSFDKLPRLPSLSSSLPGEIVPGCEYAGIGGGGGSDIISASLLAQLLGPTGGKSMRLLVSTRTWAIGSQGKTRANLGFKREVFNHGGHAVDKEGREVPGTFLVKQDTCTGGRDLETIPLADNVEVFIVLDQAGSVSHIRPQERAELAVQLEEVVSQANYPVDTIVTVDTGGDVFVRCGDNEALPDQDYRVQKAVNNLASKYNLVTAVMAPGVDAPQDAPQIALDAGGMVYRLATDEKQRLLNLLTEEYRMDGSDPGRFGKTNLALQAALRGVIGWTSLDLPRHVIDTWQNPWSSFVYIQECMSDIIFLPTKALLRLLEFKES